MYLIEKQVEDWKKLDLLTPNRLLFQANAYTGELVKVLTSLLPITISE